MLPRACEIQDLAPLTSKASRISCPTAPSVSAGRRSPADAYAPRCAASLNVCVAKNAHHRRTGTNVQCNHSRTSASLPQRTGLYRGTDAWGYTSAQRCRPTALLMCVLKHLRHRCSWYVDVKRSGMELERHARTITM